MVKRRPLNQEDNQAQHLIQTHDLRCVAPQTQAKEKFSSLCGMKNPKY